MDNPYQPSYRPRPTRNVTRKWAQAKQVDYGGDEWGDDPYAEPSQPALSQDRRSFTNPVAVNTHQRLSYDQNPEHRVFSAGATPPVHQFPPFQNAPPTGQRFYGQNSAIVQPNAPQDPMGRTSTDSGASSNNTRFPPRKSSLGQQDMPDAVRMSAEPLPQPPAPAGTASKPLPFIRPADIYKRMEEEREKERRSQESSRASMESASKDAPDQPPSPPSDADASRRMKPTLDTVAERKSEYLESSLTTPIKPKPELSQQSESPVQMRPINTNVLQAPSIPSASSRYTDRPDPVSASTVDSRFPSRNVSQTEGQPQMPSSQLPRVSRTSTFGSDISQSNGPTAPRQPDQPPPPPPKDASDDLQHKASLGYRTWVTDAFQSQNQTSSPALTDPSIARSNTVSTSEISPIVGSSREPDFGRALAQNTIQTDAAQPHHNDGALVPDKNNDLFSPPKRIGTNRRDSGSPARRPLSMDVPTLPEPQSAVVSPYDETELAKDTAKEAQLLRPGSAVLVQQRALSKESIHDDDQPGDSQLMAPSLRKQPSHQSELSDLSNKRSASEEWDKWSAAKKEAHERHGIQDSNPTTPGLDSSLAAFPAPPFESLDRSFHMPAGSKDDKTKPLSGIAGLPSQRPQVQRDESFRPQLPGGWMSSTSIQKATSPEPISLAQPRPAFAAIDQRTESTDSIPTAKPPREANWRSQYTSGPQAQAFAAAAAAGSALAGAFSGPALTSTTNTESDVSSINTDEGPTGYQKDPSMSARDFAAPSAPPQVSQQSESRDFAAAKPDVIDATPRAPPGPFSKPHGEKPTPLATGMTDVKPPSSDHAGEESPSKESERWWSDEEDAPPIPQAPLPLRTNRLSTADPTRPTISPIRTHSDSDSGPDADQLESDIVKSLTPKSSNIAETRKIEAGRTSPVREENLQSVSPPFAAAALAVSPGREYKAVQEQNTFQPLSAPQSKPQSPVPEKLPSLDLRRTQPQPTNAGKDVEKVPTQHTDSRLDSVGVPFTGSSAIKSVDAAQPSKPTRSATKEFAIYDDVSTMPSTSTISQGGFEPYSTSPSRANASQYPASVTANEAATIPATDHRPLSSTVSSFPESNTTIREVPKSLSGPNENGSNTPPSADLQGSHPPSPATPHSTKPLPIPSSYDPNRSFPAEQVPFDRIIGMGNAQARIRAYNENREAYSEPVGHLENWLSYMNTPERADAFVVKPTSDSPYVAPGPRNTRRDSTGPPSGRQQMQEDGKRLLASATKYGAKAGVLGKGLFSKGKEKLRTVSAGQKGPLMSRNKNASVPEVTHRSPTANNSAPQLPPPSVATPIDESVLSAYFSSRDNPLDTQTNRRTADEPPFSPISEASTTQQETALDRTVSALSDEQSPQSGSTVRAQTSRPSTAHRVAAQTIAVKPQIGDISKIETSNRHISNELLNPSNIDDAARDSSVSDVSSVSDQQEQRRSQALNRVSPPPEAKSSRDPQPHFAAQAVRSTVPSEQQHSQHAPSYSTAMASVRMPQPKDVEALEDREEEQSLPAYNQPQQRPPRIAPGVQIVPIARISADERVSRPEPSRPFSFVGSESLSKTGPIANRSVDISGSFSNASHPGNEQNAGFQPLTLNAAELQRSENAESPLPSARHNPEDFARRTPEEFARIRQNSVPVRPQPKEQQAYRIPGPYGQELRSPRPKNSSPKLEQYGDTSDAQFPPGEGIDSIPPTANALAVAAQRDQALGHQSVYHNQPPPQRTHGHTPTSQEQFSAASSYTDQKPGPEREWDREPRRQSKLMGLFRTRSKSRSRRGSREQIERRPEEQLDSSKRNSLLGLSSRGSMTGGNMQPQKQEQYSNLPDDRNQLYGRPSAGGRRMSKELFKSTTFGQQAQGYAAHHQQPERPSATPAGKKKRFSGLFSRSSTRSEVPPRASTMPSTAAPAGVGYQGQPISPQGYPIQTHQIPPQSMYAESQQQAHPPYRPLAPGQPFQGMTQPIEGYYGSQSDPSRGQPQHHLQQQNSFGNSFIDEQSVYSNAGSFQQPIVGTSTSLYQHQNRPYQYGDSNAQHYYPPPQQFQRPDLPRINTGDNQPSVDTQDQVLRDNFASLHQSPSTVQQYQSPSQPSNLQQYHSPSQPQNQQQYRPPSTRANKDISHGSDFRQTSSPGVEPSRITPRVAALHVRSRSPKLGRRSSEDFNEELNNLSVQQNRSPVAALGTFSSMKVSPTGGIPRSADEQEKPWAINLPEDEHKQGKEATDPTSASSSKAREMRRVMLERTPQQSPVQTSSERRPQTVADRFMGNTTKKATSPTAQATTATLNTSPAVIAQNINAGQNPSVRIMDTTLAGAISDANIGRNTKLRNTDNPIPDPRTNLGAGAVSHESSQAQREPQPTQQTSRSLPQTVPVPPQPPVSPPPAPNTKAAAPTTTNEAGVKQTLSQHRGTGKPEGKAPEIHEMPGSKPEGYESDEEPVMSATAYPGQEWQPVFDRWDD